MPPKQSDHIEHLLTGRERRDDSMTSPSLSLRQVRASLLTPPQLIFGNSHTGWICHFLSVAFGLVNCVDQSLMYTVENSFERGMVIYTSLGIFYCKTQYLPCESCWSVADVTLSGRQTTGSQLFVFRRPICVVRLRFYALKIRQTAFCFTWDYEFRRSQERRPIDETTESRHSHVLPSYPPGQSGWPSEKQLLSLRYATLSCE